MVQVTVDVDPAQILVVDLQESYRMTLSSIEGLLAQKTLRQFEVEDLKNDREILAALDRVLQYYMPRDEYDKFKASTDL